MSAALSQERYALTPRTEKVSEVTSACGDVTEEEMTVDARDSAEDSAGESATKGGPEVPDPEVGRRPLSWRVGSFALRYGMVWVLVGLVIVAQYLYPTFLTADNIRNMMSQNAPTAIIAVGMTFVIIAGGFDLSVGAIYGLGAVTFATMTAHLSLIENLLVVCLVGVVTGLFNGMIITKLKVNPFVATLGTSSLFLGAAFIYSNN
jgi:hypothetical protein